MNELLTRVDDRDEIDRYSALMGISHILDRKLGDLSGGAAESSVMCHSAKGSRRLLL